MALTDPTGMGSDPCENNTSCLAGIPGCLNNVKLCQQTQFGFDPFVTDAFRFLNSGITDEENGTLNFGSFASSAPLFSATGYGKADVLIASTPRKTRTATRQQIQQACVNEYSNSAVGKAIQFFSLYNLATNIKGAWADWTVLPLAKLFTLQVMKRASQAIGNTEFLSVTSGASTAVISPTAAAIHGGEKIAGRLAGPGIVLATGVDVLVQAGCANSALNATGQANIPMAPTMF